MTKIMTSDYHENLESPNTLNKVNLISITHLKSDPHSNFHNFLFSLSLTGLLKLYLTV